MVGMTALPFAEHSVTCVSYVKHTEYTGIWSAGLAQYIPQSNNFVVFSSYFHSAATLDPAGSIWVGHAVCCMPVQAKHALLARKLFSSCMPQQPHLLLHLAWHGLCCCCTNASAAFVANMRMILIVVYTYM